MATTGSSGAHTHDYTVTTGPQGPAGPPGPTADLTALTARVAALEAIIKPPVVPPPPTMSGIYGSGLGGDTRNNHHLDARVSYRFRSSGGVPRSIKVSERTGTGYSLGNGGTIRASIQTDNAGLPSGTVLASVEWAPGNPGTSERWPEHLFTAASALVKGSVYHVVFDNTAASPAANYISLNALYTFSGSADHPVAPDLALFHGTSLQAHDVPIFDLAYADGSHDGQAYIGNMIENFGVISDAQKVRQTLTFPAFTVSAVAVRVRRTSGTSPLILRLEHGDGSLVEEVSIAAATIAQSAAGSDNGGAVWAKGSFAAPLSLPAGAYNLVLRCAAGTGYTAAPLQDGITKGLLSPAYRGGGAEKSSGGSWAPLYPYIDNGPVDLQFYFDVTA